MDAQAGFECISVYSSPCTPSLQVLSAARENDGGRSLSSSPLAPLIAAASPLQPQPVFVRNIHSCINDENVVQVR